MIEQKIESAIGSIHDGIVTPAIGSHIGMYIGATNDGLGLHHMVYEVVDNAIDVALVDAVRPISVWVASVNSPTQTVLRFGGDDWNR